MFDALAFEVCSVCGLRVLGEASKDISVSSFFAVCWTEPTCFSLNFNKNCYTYKKIMRIR
jgi:hypothetical protein